MRLIEGKCYNCSSIIRLDGDAEKNYCIFCWAEFDTAQAQALMKSDEGHEYKNETFEQPGGEAVLKTQGFYQSGGRVQSQKRKSNSAPAPRKEKKESVLEKVAKINKPIEMPVINKRAVTTLLAGLLVFIILPTVLLIPKTKTRNTKREALNASFISEMKKTDSTYTKFDSHYFGILGMNNQKVSTFVIGDLNQEIAEKIHQTYVQVYKAEYPDYSGNIQVECIGKDNNKIVVGTK